MQDRYAGDIGDYFKFGLLRALSSGRKLGVGWYKTADSSNNDGRHVKYLNDDRASTWGRYDPMLYERLRRLVHADHRTVADLEGIIEGDVIFHGNPLTRSTDRVSWFEGMKESFRDRNLVFLDPDNGIDPAPDATRRARSIKSVTLEEIKSLSFLRPLIIYHHQTRFKGGHIAEIAHLGQTLQKRGLGCILALRAGSFSPRVFFIVEATGEIWHAAEAFARQWSPHVTFHCIDGPPDSLGLPPSDIYSDKSEAAREALADRVHAGDFLKYSPPPSDVAGRSPSPPGRNFMTCPVFTHQLTALPRHIDELGHVNNAVWVQWIQDVAVEHWRTVADPAHDAAYVWVIVRHEIDYLRPAFEGDVLTARTWVGEAPKGARFDRHMEFAGEDGKVRVRAVTQWAIVDKALGRPIRVPAEVIAPFMGD